MQGNRSLPKASKRQLESVVPRDECDVRAILDAIPDLIWLKNPNGVYIDCNPAVECLLGAEKSVILGKTDYDFFDENLADFFRQRDREACVSDKPIRNEEWLTFADRGQRRLYETTKTAMRDAGGKFIGILGIARDITGRAAHQKNDESLCRRKIGGKRVLDSAADAIFIADSQGRYQYVNEQAVHMLGYTRDELLRMRVGDLTPGEDSADVLAAVEKLYSTGSLRREFRLRHRKGEYIPMDFNATVLPDGRTYISYRDMRAHKLAEAEREQQRETMVREVHHRIKNTLQGVAGLLQRELGKFQELDPRLDVAISQLNAIAAVHGLQAACSDEAIPLSSSVRNICHIVSELAQRPVVLNIIEGSGSFDLLRVNHNDAIPVALVINELIFNAIKHSPPVSGAPTVSLQATDKGIKLRISNALAEMPNFNFDTGNKLGTGLSLVRSLLPRQGAHLNFQVDSQSGFMLTTLRLLAPVMVQSVK